MLIQLKNKDTLIVDDFKFKCSVGKKGITKNKIEGDKCTPRGVFELGPLYFRSDRIKKPQTKLKIKSINKYMGWCDDPKSKFYNKEIKLKNNIHSEKLLRKDYKYDLFIVIKSNIKSVPYRGSAIFIHLTKNYLPTAGCIALREKDFFILLKLIDKQTKIIIN